MFSLVKVDRHAGRNVLPQSSGSERNQHEADSKQSTADEVEEICLLLPDYTALYPRK
jgi:hypothetical protein